MKKIELVTMTDVRNEIFNILTKEGKTNIKISTRLAKNIDRKLKDIEVKIDILYKFYNKLREEIIVLNHGS